MNRNKPDLIIGIGASAGGLDAIEQFFQSAPFSSQVAYVIVQHLSPDFKSLMDELLARRTQIPILHAQEGQPLKPNTIYLNPPKKDLTIQDGCFRFSPREERQTEMPIDIFFRSLAEDAAEHAVAIVLSGTGSDGSRGIRDVQNAGGLVIVQDPQTAQFDGMPRNAVATGAYDFILSPVEMHEVIAQFALDPLTKASAAQQRLAFSADEYDNIIAVLKRSYQIDFAQYKATTIRRRIARRISFKNYFSVGEYLEALTKDEKELAALYQDLLIGVTEFFRDPEAFRILEKRVLPEIFQHKKGRDEEIRVWCAACSTGEEAYSVAISLADAAREFNFRGKIFVFATDVHRASLDAASNNRFKKSQLKNVSPDRLQRYFREDAAGEYRVVPEIREMIVFASHNLLKDPPFTRIDLILCRNFLIYLQQTAQDQVLALFHFALKTNSFLFLGSSEGLNRIAGEFETIDVKWKIYQKVRDSKLNFDFLPGSASETVRQHPTPRSVFQPGLRLSQDRQMLPIYDTLLEQTVENGLLVAEDRSLLHVFGNARNYLTLPTGRLDSDVLSLLEGDLRLAVSTGMQRALHTKAAVVSRAVQVFSTGAPEQLDLSIRYFPAGKTRAGFFLVTFDSPQTPPPVVLPAADNPCASLENNQLLQSRVSDLEQELKSARENLQAMVEELQTTNEELQATNEELLAANEELQSTNEELHSVNEELYTVNAEYERKNRELQVLNLDHDNLLESLDVGTLFVDGELRIRKYNTALTKYFRLLPQDISRSIVDIAYQLDGQATMLDDLREVLASGNPVEKEIRSHEGIYLLKKIMPFRAPHGETDGAIMTFTNIQNVKSAQAAYQAELEKRVEDRTRELTETLSALRQREERYRNELAVAAAVQSDLLPPPLETELFSLQTLSSPFHEVSGDSYWYYWNKESNLLSCYVIDVSGHGLSTALQTSAINVLFREALAAGYSPAQMLTQVNTRAANYLQDSFAAALCFQIDFTAKTLCYASAGINYFLAGSAALGPVVSVPGLLLGIMEEEQFEEHTIPIASGDCFYFLTDGLWEVLPEPASLPVGQFGRVMKLMERLCNSAKAESLPGRFRGLVPWDDATVVSVRVK